MNILDYAKRLGIDLPGTKAIDIEAGKAGYEKYLAETQAERDSLAKFYELENNAPKWWQLGKQLKTAIDNYDYIVGDAKSREEMAQGTPMIQDAKKAMQYENERPNDGWSDDEKWAFGEKYATSPEEAYKLALVINTRHKRKAKEEKEKKVSAWAGKNPINMALATAGSIGTNIFAGGVGYVSANADRELYGKVYDRDYLMPHEFANSLQGGVSEKMNKWSGTIDEDVPIIGGKGLGDVHNIGQSILTTWALSQTGQFGTLAAYFGMSASNGFSDAKARGASDDQAIKMGFLSGAAEAIPEMISMDKLLSVKSSVAVENLFKSALKQAGQEAGEEAITSILTDVADRWVMDDKSNFNLMVNQLVASGMSLEEAQKKAWFDTIEGYAFDAITGAVSGAANVGVQMGSNAITQRYLSGEANAKAKEAYTPIQNDLIAEGKQHKTSEKFATKMENKLAKGKELSGYDLRVLAYETENAARTDEVDTVRKAIVEKMKAEGLDESKAKSLGEIALNKAIGHEVSKLQETKLKNNEIASKVYRQISKDVMDSGAGDSAWAEETPIRKLRAELESQKAAEEMQNGKMPIETPKATQTEVASPEINSDITTTAKLKQMKNAVVTDAAKLDTLNQLVEESKTRDVSGKISEIKAKNKQPVKMEVKTSTEKAIAEEIKKFSAKDIKGKYTIKDGKRVYKTTKDSKLHIDGVSSSLTREDIIELSAIEKIANELGVDIYVYETHEQNGERVYTDKDGKRYTDSGYYDIKNNTIHIDLRAGMKGEGTMLYTASHEVVHFIKKNASDHFDALEKLVTKALVDGGYSIEKLIDNQKAILKQNGWDGTEANFEEVAREEMVADACMKFLASKNAVAEIKALKTENKGLWSTLKKFFTSFFNKINNVYKNTPPDAPEAEYISSMHKAAKQIRDAFMEGAVAASKNAAKTETKASFEESYQKSKDVRKNARYSKEHIAQLQSLDASTSTVPMDKLVERYESIIKIWNELGGEINSDFLKQWNDKNGKDRAFTVFKAQAGYKYNVELSSMCKKGIPLFEAIDRIVREEVMDKLKTKTLGKAEKEVLYELLKEKHFDIPCAICYVEQARQREGDIIDAFLDGKVEKTSTGKTKTYKIGWNETFDALEKGMKARGVDYTFAEVDRSIASDSYAKETMPVMDEKTQKAFYSTLLQLINKEITRYNAEKDAKTKARMPLTSITPSEIKRCLGGTLPANLKLYKTIAMNPDSRFRIKNDLLYSSATTTNLASFHHDLYSLFNMQGGVSGYKSKQGAVVYWGDILTKKWDSSKLRKEGGVRNQSNSDFMMYTLLDQAQMYIDFTAKGYYLQAYTKVISELKLFGLSKGKINASLIPRVEIYRKDNGFEVDIEKTRENAGLDKDGNPIYDDVEGIPHKEAFMLIEDADYSKNIGGICIGYSDKHVSKLLDDNRIQLIIGYHDKTDDPDKRYYGARYAKNYNGENEARIKNADGTFTTKHVGFNQFVIAAEKLFKKDTTSVEYNGKTYKYDDIPKLAADMYLKMCADKNYIPAYDQFSSHKNYYKLLADFSLYDSEGHYAPHQKVAYEMPDVIPYLDEDGNKKYMPTRDYIKKELEKELTVRDNISAALSDHSEEGIIPKFIKTVNEMHESKDIRRKSRITPNQDAAYMDAVNRGDMKTAQSMVEGAARLAGYPTRLLHGTTQFGFTEADVSKSDDRMSFFATDSLETARTYSGTESTRAIATASQQTEADQERLIKDIHSDGMDLAEYCNRTLGIRDWVGYDYVTQKVDECIEELEHGASMSDMKDEFLGFCDELYYSLLDNYYYSYYNEKEFSYEAFQESEEADAISDNYYAIVDDIIGKMAMFDFDASFGIYDLFANTDNLFEIDAKGSLWSKIPFAEYSTSQTTANTREIARYAKSKGYAGVKISNVFDDGGRHTSKQTKPSSVYIFFNPQQQVKSADPVTYDDNGNVIPLSERFNEQSKDIRHKIRYPSFTQTDIDNNIKAIADMEVVAKIDGAKLEKTGNKPFDIFNKYFESLGNNIYSDVFGDIALPKSSVKSEIRHGITAEKIASIEAIPSVIKEGKVIFFNTKAGSDVERIVVAAPIQIGETDYFMGVMLQRDTQSQRLYLHNVVAVKTKETISSSQDNSLTNWSDEDNSRLFITMILQRINDVKISKQKSSENSSEKHEIRSKTRATVTTASAPYVSPTASSIVTEIDSGYDYTKGDKVVTAALSAQIAFTNAQAGIEHRGKQYGVKNIESLVQAARVSSQQAQQMIAGSQRRIGSDTKEYQGEGLEKIARPIFAMSPEKQRAFYDYLFHQHNADRMSLERRSIEWNEETKKKLATANKTKDSLEKEMNKLLKERSTLSLKNADKPRKQEIDTRVKQIKAELRTLKKQITALNNQVDDFVALKNKPVIGLNQEAVAARKEELAQQMKELVKERQKIAKRKGNNTKQLIELTKQVEALRQEMENVTDTVSEEESREIIAKYEAAYDDFIGIAEKIWNYNKNLNLYRVDTGLIDQDTFDYLNKLYPHYVPTYRADTKTGIAAVKGKNNIAINQSIKGAKGSTKDLLNPIVIMARQTMETVRAGRINQIADALYEGAKGDKTYIAEVSRKKVKKSEVVDIDPMELRPKNNQVTFFKNGQRITLQVATEIFQGFDAFAPLQTSKNPIFRGLEIVMNSFKKLVTSANPGFLIRNGIRDLQDAGINTKYEKTFLQNYAKAQHYITHDHELWQLYLAMGGGNESYFDFDKGFTKQQTKIGFSKKIQDADAGNVKHAAEVAARYTLTAIENANAYIETLPRFAEFISSIEAGNTAEQAMLDAADVTTNFARSGTITRQLNRYFIPFLNAKIQGASKAVRNVVDAFGERNWKKVSLNLGRLFVKAVIVGVLPMALNGLMYRDDEDYEDLRETDKENNFLIKIGDTFIKIPRGRIASIVGGAFNRAVFAEEFDLKGYLKNASSQLSPVEGIDRSILSPFTDVKNNVTWYGSAIEGKQFENLAPAKRYDESTSSIAIAMAKALNGIGIEASPKKIHYLLDQYSGVIGDFVLPATTKKAEKDFISGNFTLDPVTSNKLSDKFYDLYYDAQYSKNDGSKVGEYQVKHLNRVKDAISKMYEEKSKIQNSTLSDKEKLAKTEAIQILINEMYKTAIEDFDLITNAIKSTSGVKDEYRYAEIIRLVYGAEKALEEYNEKVYEKSTLLKQTGISYDVFYNYYFSTRDIESDKDKKGNSIAGSKRKKFIEAIEKLNTSEENKLILIAASGYAFDDAKDRDKLLKYINSLKISDKSKRELADLLDFEYKNGKITAKS